MDDVQKGVEALRRTLAAFTQRTFVYANQDVVLDYPIGTVTRISESREGQPIVTYENTNEVVTQFLDVSVQIDYIAPFTHSDTNTSMFSSREVLGQVQAGYRSETWKSLFVFNADALSIDVAIFRMENLTGPVRIEGAENLWSARMTAELSVLNKYTKTSAFIDSSTAFPFHLNLNIKGKKPTAFFNDNVCVRATLNSNRRIVSDLQLCDD